MKSPFSLKIMATLLFLIVACTPQKRNDDIKIISLEREVGRGSVEKLSDYVKDIRYVVLETNDSSVLGNIVSVFYENKLIYVQDNNNLCKIFDENGKYLRTFKRIGRGPQEYLDIRGFDVNEENGDIYILSNDGQIKEYDSKGNFIKSIPRPMQLKKGTYWDCKKIDGKNYIVSTFTMSEVSETKYFVCDVSSNILKEVTHVTKTRAADARNNMINIDPDRFYRYRDDIRIVSKNDTIFSIDKNLQITDKYIMDFGKYRQSPDMSAEDWISTDKMFISKLPMYCETDDYLFLAFNFRGFATEPVEKVMKLPDGSESVRKWPYVYGIFNKKSGKLSLLNQPYKGELGLLNDINNGFVFWPRFRSSKGEMITCYNALNFIENAESGTYDSPVIKEIAAKLKENDNPVVAITTPF
ncbi:MAG: 6-bladed beta-propeller [Bacteroidales bacterium]|jgi:hypothetical protein